MTTAAPTRRQVLVGAVSVGLLAACGEPRTTTASTNVSPRAATVEVLLDATATQPPGTTPMAELVAKALPDATVTSHRAHADQAKQLQTAADRGIGLVVLQSIDTQAIGKAIKKAADDGVQIIALDAIPHHLDGLALVLGWDEFSAGEKEIAAVAKELARRTSERPPHHIELFAGAPDDLRAKGRFDGEAFAMKALSKEGSLIVKSGQTSFQTAAVAPGSQEAFVQRLTTTFEVTYPRHTLDALVMPGDAYRSTVEATCRKLKRKVPLLLGSGATVDGVNAVAAGTQFSTIYRDPAPLASRLAKVVAAMQEGRSIDYNPKTSYRNEVRSVPGVFLLPTLVTKATGGAALAGNPVLAPLLKA